MTREIHANINTGVSLVECLREIDEREAWFSYGDITMLMGSYGVGGQRTVNRKSMEVNI